MKKYVALLLDPNYEEGDCMPLDFVYPLFISDSLEEAKDKLKKTIVNLYEKEKENAKGFIDRYFKQNKNIDEKKILDQYLLQGTINEEEYAKYKHSLRECMEYYMIRDLEIGLNRCLDCIEKYNRYPEIDSFGRPPFGYRTGDIGIDAIIKEIKED